MNDEYKLTFEPKISGTSVLNCHLKPMFNGYGIIYLEQLLEEVKTQECMNYILDEFRFHKGEEKWYTTMDYDTLYKCTILNNTDEKHTAYRKQIEEYFGSSWLKQYLRFGH